MVKDEHSGQGKKTGASSTENQTDYTFFSCPAVGLMKQLLREVALLKNKLCEHSHSENDLLDNSDLMREFKISRSCSQNWRNSGMPFSKRGSKIYYLRSDVKAFISKGKRKGF